MGCHCEVNCMDYFLCLLCLKSEAGQYLYVGMWRVWQILINKRPRDFRLVPNLSISDTMSVQSSGRSRLH